MLKQPCVIPNQKEQATPLTSCAEICASSDEAPKQEAMRSADDRMNLCKRLKKDVKEEGRN